MLKTEEKRSDVNLASYLLLDAFKKDCDIAIVFSNDADLKEPIGFAIGELGYWGAPERPGFAIARD